MRVSSRVPTRVFSAAVLCAMLLTTAYAFGFGTERTPAPLTHGKTAGILSYIDDQLLGRERYKRYTLSVSAGETWTIEASSPHFSPYLVLRGDRVQRDAGGELGVHRTTLRFVARENDEMELYVSTAASHELGAYTIHATKEAGAAPPQTPTPNTTVELVPGSRVDGRIRREVNRTVSGFLVQRYVYHGQAGERISVRTTSRGFVPLLMIHGNGLAVHSGSPVGRRRNIELDATLPETGRYIVRVLAGPGVQDAKYTLRLRQHSTRGANMQRTRRLVLGARVEGTLEQGDRRLEDGQWADRYMLRLEKGQRVSLGLQSAGFDGGLVVQLPENDGRSGLDDSALEDATTGGTRQHRNASAEIAVEREHEGLLHVHAPTTGDYEVIVHARDAGAGGRYVVSAVREQPAIARVPMEDERANPTRILLRADANTRGQLRSDDPKMTDQSVYRAYRLPVSKGERWSVEMTSKSFDTHLELRGNDGFAPKSDARGPQDTASRVTFDAPYTGDVTIYATSRLPRATGPFSLRAYRGEPEADNDRADDGRLIAMLVGISTYGPEEWTDLPYCAADAVRIGDALQDTGMLAPESMILVDNTATREALDEAFEHAADVVGPNDVFIFFFSGHGGQLRSNDPMERDGLDETLVLYDEQIRDDELGDLLLKIDSRLSLVVLDACYSGGFRDTLRRRKNQIGIFSSEEDVSSLVAEQFESGGYLSNILAYALGVSADRYPADGTVTVDELLQYIRSAWGELGQVIAVDSNDRFAHQELVIERGFTSSQETVLKRPETQR